MRGIIKSLVKELGDSIMLACRHDDVSKLFDLLCHEDDMLIEVYTGSDANTGIIAIPFDVNMEKLSVILSKAKELSNSKECSGIKAFITLNSGKVYHSDMDTDDAVDAFIEHLKGVRYR